MFGVRRYNYQNFTKDVLMKDVSTDRLRGPGPGDRAPDFEGRTPEGDKVRLSDLRGDKNVVLTFGSATCPFTARSIRGLNSLYDEYSGDEVQFLFVYVREAHPGEKLPAHHSMEDKLRAAELFRDEERVDIPIIVDDLDGDIHRKYGKLPNSTYIIDRSGRVAFRSLWTRASVIENALQELLQRQEERDVDHAIVSGGQDTSMPSTYAMLHAHRALDRGGKGALQDFRREMGVPGRVAVLGGRVIEPIANNPGKTLVTLGIAAGVITGGILAGRALRNRLRTRTPYDIQQRARRTARGEYEEAVGI